MDKKLLYDKPMFLKSMWGVLGLICLAVYGLLCFTKKKEDLVKGKIEFVGQTYEQLPSRHAGKYRFIKVEGFGKPFEVFVGKDAGDFKPEFEQVDLLQAGDEVLVYYVAGQKDFDAVHNVQRIESNGKAFFIAGKSTIWIMGVCLVLGVVIAIVLMILKSKGRII
ncbi:MAG TPA: hypothetical protein VL092_01770 [Chitinophagaceae bacterium]|nr:hypothetical protein [Chitinophagaceae bacterium]